MIAPTLALALALAGSPAGSRVLAQVDAVSITRADLEERLRVLRAQGAPARPGQAVQDLVDEALLAAEARRLGVDREPAIAAEIDGERRRLAADAFLASVVPEPKDAQLQELYHATGDSARLVLVKVETEAEARKVLERVKAGGDLAAEARRSIDPALAAKAGDTGVVTRAAMDPALAAAVFAAEKGALVGPVQLKLGWGVARVLDRQIADPAGFPARREAIATFARDQLRRDARGHVTEQLRKRSGVKLDEEFLRKVGTAGPPTEKDLDHVVATVAGRPLRYREIAAVEGRTTRGHGAGAARIALASREVDRRLLEEEALAKGFGKSPEVARVLPAIERNLLAGAVAARIGGRPDAGLSDPAIRATLERLRKAARISIDRDAVPAAERELR